MVLLNQALISDIIYHSSEWELFVFPLNIYLKNILVCYICELFSFGLLGLLLFFACLNNVQNVYEFISTHYDSVCNRFVICINVFSHPGTKKKCASCKPTFQYFSKSRLLPQIFIIALNTKYF